MKILVTGATGPLGISVVETLLKKIPTKQIHTLSRNAEKVAEMQSKGLKAFLGNYNDIDSLELAMKSVDTVLLISSSDRVGDRMQQHRNVVDAAKKVGVKNIAYTSRSLRDRNTLANKMMVEHFVTEDYIKASGLKYTIFRNALYMDSVQYYVGKQVFETGVFAQPAGNGKVAYALRKDQGEAMANVLLEGNCENRVYKFTGNETYSFYDVATALTELSGKEIKYTPVEIPVYEDLMKATGMPEMFVKMMIGFNTDIKNGQESEITTDLENKLGRKPTALKDGLKELFGL